MATFYRCDVCTKELASKLELAEFSIEQDYPALDLNHYRYRLPVKKEICRRCILSVLEHADTLKPELT